MVQLIVKELGIALYVKRIKYVYTANEVKERKGLFSKSLYPIIVTFIDEAGIEKNYEKKFNSPDEALKAFDMITTALEKENEKENENGCII